MSDQAWEQGPQLKAYETTRGGLALSSALHLVPLAPSSDTQPSTAALATPQQSVEHGTQRHHERQQVRRRNRRPRQAILARRHLYLPNLPCFVSAQDVVDGAECSPGCAVSKTAMVMAMVTSLASSASSTTSSRSGWTQSGSARTTRALESTKVSARQCGWQTRGGGDV